jgi:hypothetical protein
MQIVEERVIGDDVRLIENVIGRLICDGLDKGLGKFL